MSNKANNTVLKLGEAISLKAKDGQHGKEVEISFNNGFINFNTSVPMASILNYFLPENKVVSKIIDTNPDPKATPTPKKRK
jgi:hypothetical protein